MARMTPRGNWGGMRQGMPPAMPQMPQVAPASAPPDIESLLSMLPPEQQAAFRAQYAQYAPPTPPQFNPVDVAPQGAMEGMAQSLGPHPFNMPQGYMRGGSGGAFLTGLASGFGNALTARGASSYQNRIGQAQAGQQAQKASYDASAAENRGARSSMIGQLTGMAGRGKPAGDERVPIMNNDWEYLKGKNGIPKQIQDEYAKNDGTLSAPAYKSFQAAVDNERATERANIAARTVQTTATQEDLVKRANGILDAVESGRANPNLELYGTNRDGLKSLLPQLAQERGLDTATLRQNWAANNRGILAANSSQQLRMRQAANNIPMLIDQLVGKAGPDGARSVGGVLASLHNSRLPIVNVVGQWTAKQAGKKGPQNQYNQLINKIATEQATLLNGGNKPHETVLKTLLHSFEMSDNPSNIVDAVNTAEESVRNYQESIANVGPITRSTPYIPGERQSNPITGPNFNLGTNPAAGTKPPAGQKARVKVVGPKGETGTIEDGDALPPGWRKR